MDASASIRPLLACFSPLHTVGEVSRRLYLTPLAVTAALVFSGCSSAPALEKQSLFDVARTGVAKNVCTLAPQSTIELAFPSLTSYLKGAALTVEEKSFPASGPDATTVSCFWDTSAGPVTLSVVRGRTAPQMMLNSPDVSFKYEGVSFVPLSLAEAIVVETAPDEVVFLSAPGLVSRSALIEAARLIVLPSATNIPDMPLPVGARTRIDVFRTTFEIDVCAEQLTLDAPAKQNADGPAFASNAPGVIDIFPQTDADAYSLATLKRAFKAAGVTWTASALSVGDTEHPLTCDNKPAAIWGFIWDDTSSDSPTSGPLSGEELAKTAVTSNAWRVLLVVSASKPSNPSRTPAMPDVVYNVSQQAPAG